MDGNQILTFYKGIPGSILIRKIRNQTLVGELIFIKAILSQWGNFNPITTTLILLVSHTKTSKLWIWEPAMALRRLLVGFLIYKTTVMRNHVRSKNYNDHKLRFFTYLSWVFLQRIFRPKLDFTWSIVKDQNNDDFHKIQIFYPGKQKCLCKFLLCNSFQHINQRWKILDQETRSIYFTRHQTT